MEQALLNADFLLDSQRVEDSNQGDAIRQRERVSHLIPQ